MKELLKKIGIWDKLKKIKDNNQRKRNLTMNYKFENRKKDKNKVCFILAGYKEFLYDVIFERILKFIPEDVEICLLSSGKYSQILSEIAEKNNWSYLSTKRNNVSLIQNVAITIFNKADYIYKLDEDIFITENYFENLFKTYQECQKNGDYRVGFVAPIIPINGFGNMLVLERFEKLEYYTNKFEKPLYAAGRDRMVESNPEVAKFFWGKDKILPNIDEMNKIFNNDKFGYVACPIRFSIGAILFTRKFWENMGMFKVHRGSGMGSDEEQICSYCIKSSQAIIVSKNSLVGHLSFGKQNKPMKEYFETNKNNFFIQGC